MSSPPCVRIGCAGWSLPRAEQERFPGEGSHLERYAAVFDTTEINSSFHRPHRPATYARWAAAVPSSFRFSVKLPKTITHDRRMRGTGELIEIFLSEAGGLGEKLGCLLVQLPPSLDFDPAAVAGFFSDLRSRTPVPLAYEPRHPNWFTSPADDLLGDHQVARVAADPARVPEAAEPGGWRGLIYHRLHGSPDMYRSAYTDEYLVAFAARLREEAGEGRAVWCVFDNTTLGAATRNALDLRFGAGDR